ncbi:hypothetical protein II898_09520 [bacterium]|nr:hypothetical protein [bacterium]
MPASFEPKPLLPKFANEIRSGVCARTASCSVELPYCRDVKDLSIDHDPSCVSRCS